MTQNNLDTPEAGDGPAQPAFDATAEARRLLRSIRAGTLATTDGAGHPFASLVNVATAADGSPVLLLSQLAAHTGHLAQRPRCALLLTETGKGDPLAHPRLTVMADAVPDGDEALRSRFLRRHPKAALYAGFGDFGIWRLQPVGTHLNGGFARAAQVPADDLLLPLAGAEALLATDEGAVAHMNEDHADALSLYAQHFAGEADGPWRATGFDPEGMDLLAGTRTARILFPQRIEDAGALRQCLVAMVKLARQALPPP